MNEDNPEEEKSESEEIPQEKKKLSKGKKVAIASSVVIGVIAVVAFAFFVYILYCIFAKAIPVAIGKIVETMVQSSIQAIFGG